MALVEVPYFVAADGGGITILPTNAEAMHVLLQRLLRTGQPLVILGYKECSLVFKVSKNNSIRVCQQKYSIYLNRPTVEHFMNDIRCLCDVGLKRPLAIYQHGAHTDYEIYSKDHTRCWNFTVSYRYESKFTPKQNVGTIADWMAGCHG